MYTRCTTEKAAAQQALLERTLLNAMMQGAYNEITVSFLCEQAGLSRKTFYRLFSNKDSVLHALIDHTLMRYMVYRPAEFGFAGTPDELHLFFSFWLKERQLLDALQANGLTVLLLERTMLYVSNVEPGVLHHFAINSAEAQQEILLFYFSGIMSLVISWHQSGFRKSVDQMAEILKMLMLNPPINSL